MGGHVVWNDQAVSPPHTVDSIRSLGAPGLEGSEAMTTILILLAVLFVLAFVLSACRIGTGDGEGGE